MPVPVGCGVEWVTVTTQVDTSSGVANGFHDLYPVSTGAGGATLFDVDRAEFSD